ncbi:4Fe-4S ferredoxin [Oceanidesulfovibrio indonesiensis]|uniref:4Fe-4S ferredoxin n=1 Tax=Oceanidesulfovibrio indonesiensis TaxID=54767 RepID=A0A7M3MDN2_9BACT|nr:4Fe-4S dicluster domain-containing protein [Oceanidesulfovibrio indonesiensis]TVM16827.1 4Fe-4S ferredoxin [Oceanidesulfovibrio indonesiensis]
MSKTRRDFLKIAGMSALGLGCSALPAAAADPGHAPRKAAQGPAPGTLPDNALTATHWAMVIFTRRIKGPEHFDHIINACHQYHNVPEIPGHKDEIKWIWTDSFNHTFPEKETHFLAQDLEMMDFLLLCNHCENPPCVRVCPTKATFQRDHDGIVIMDMHRCIGCRFCMAACPYGARSFNFANPRPYIDGAKLNPDYPTRMRGVVEKCNFCAERLAKGQMPACVEASEGAMLFGDLDDPNSEVRKALRENFSIRRKTTLGTQPSVYYII